MISDMGRLNSHLIDKTVRQSEPGNAFGRRLRRGGPRLAHELAVLLFLLLAPALAMGQPGGEKHATLSATIEPAALKPGDEAVVRITIDVKDGFHAQSHAPLDPNLIPFEVKMTPVAGFAFGEAKYPPGEDKTYPMLGRLNVYTGKVVTTIPVTVKETAPNGQVKFTAAVRYQICDDEVCFMPQTQNLTVQAEVSGGVDGGAAAPPPAAIADDDPAVAPVVSTSPAGSEWTIGFAFGAAFLAGLLFNIMPCVFPVLPLKAMGFYEVSHHKRSKSFLFGLVFSGGLIAVFGVLAILVLVLRLVSWGELFSYGWFIWGIVALLVLMGLSLLGAFTFQLPTGAYGFTPRHDTYGGNFLWGVLAAILATPCTAPLLPPLMLWASAKPAVIGVPAMLMVGVGMAAPYLFLSIFPELARKLPRSGPWAELFKQMMGFMLLVAAVYFGAGRLIPGVDFWWAVVAIVAIASLFLVARTVQLTDSAGAVGFSSTVAVLLLGGAIWWTARLADTGWIDYTDAAFAEARDSGQPVLVKFTANWCATCQYIEGTVFQDEQVWSAMSRADVIPLKVDLTQVGAPGHDLLLHLNPAGGIPLTALYAPGALQPVQLSSVYTSQTLLEELARINR